MNRINIIRNQSGWSLVEITVVLTLMVIILLAIYMVFEIGLFIYNQSTYSSIANQNVREPINRMLREMKESNYDTVTVTDSIYLTHPSLPGGGLDAQRCVIFASARTSVTASPPAVFVTDNATYKPLWQKYVFYYRDATYNYIFKRIEIPLVTPTTEIRKFDTPGCEWPAAFIPGQANFSSLINDKEITYTFECPLDDTTRTAIVSMNVYYTIMKRYGGTEREQMQIVESIKLMN